jgi:hypothetical protein
VFVVIAVIVAIVGATVQSRRDEHTPAARIHLLWWLVAVVGVTGLITAGFHIFDGPATAEMIGYTRGDGGFQWETAMGDLAVGVAGLMCYWYRDNFWLCVIVVQTIQYFGDAAGHVYFWVVDDNTRPYNIGFPLWTDILLPIVLWTLWFLARRSKPAVQQGG